MQKEFDVQSLADLDAVADYVLNLTKTYPIVLFHGQMGAGKTTLISKIMEKVSGLDRVSSPTFSLVNEYLLPNNDKIYHFDFYRIKSEEEALDIGLYEYFDSGKICLIEWPSKIENLLPDRFVLLKFELQSPLSRKINISVSHE